ncbi:RNA polymerase Rpb4-domain-containing protein [Glomus cerebriforme]|uniref:DNA-directed RNA polymerase III subunit RPC9 n=1 Tax=Glomus cerebriforme TaxID=658196 RepID=A0A397TKR4_9GLOM|nr:RNA polymerase Rpb4-domain-containing protein [Glomus cerebriforme]
MYNQKIIEKRNTQLSNYEVLALLRELDEKQKEQARINPQIKFAENLKTIQFENLTSSQSPSPAKTQTPEQIESILFELKKYNLTKSEKLQIINLRPQSIAELELIIEDCEDRFSIETLREMIYMIGTNLPIPGKVVRRLESGNEPLEGDEVLTFIHYETDPKKKNNLSENIHY